MIWHRFVIEGSSGDRDGGRLDIGRLDIRAISADVAGGNSAVTADMLVAELIEYLQMVLKMNAPATISGRFWTIEKTEA